jgi:hypothetical protein
MYIFTWYLPLIGELWLNEKPALNELNGPTFDPVALYSPKFNVASYGSVFSDDIPQKRYTLLDNRSLIGIATTEKADAWYPFYLTIPDIKSTQYTLNPLVLTYIGLFICVCMRIGCKAVTVLTENVIFVRSDEI